MLSRRSLLKSTVATTAFVAAPAILRATDALASSGQVNVFAWGDYIQANQIEKLKQDGRIASKSQPDGVEGIDQAIWEEEESVDLDDPSTKDS